MQGLKVKELWNGFLEVLFPAGVYCPFCRQRPLKGGILCPNCQREISFYSAGYNQCRICGKWGPFDRGELCRECQDDMPPFALARGVGPYQGLLKEMIYEFKYTGRRTLALPLGSLMAGQVLREKEYGHIDLIIPVPLYPLKLRERGFNQAALLAKEISRILNVPCKTDALVRVRETVAQSKLGKTQRRGNLEGAFILRENRFIKGRHVLLVDDILTTGQTASACSAALLKGGAAKVSLITLATGLLKEYI